MNLSLIKELLHGTRRTRRHELDELASGQVGWRFALAMLFDKCGLSHVDRLMFNIVSANIKQGDLNGVLTSDLISEKKQFLQFCVACAQEEDCG